MSETVTEVVRGEATQYVARVERLEPDEEPALETAGYHSETTLYVVFTGGNVHASHDKHAVYRALPGENRWLLEEFDRLEARLLNGD